MQTGENRPFGFVWPTAIDEYRRQIPDVHWLDVPPVDGYEKLLNEELRAPETNLVVFPTSIDEMVRFSRHQFLFPLDQELSPDVRGRYREQPLAWVTQDGHMMGAPEDYQMYGLVCRMDCLAAWGMDPPDTWEAWDAVAAVAHDRLGAHAVDMTAGGPVNRYAFFWSLFASNGMDPRHVRYQLELHQDRLTEAMSWVRAMTHENGWIPPNRLQRYFILDRPEALLDGRRQAMFFGWMKGLLELPMEIREQIEMFPFPAGPSGPGPVFPASGSVWCMPANTRHVRRGLTAIERMHESEFARLCARKGRGGFPALKACWDDEQVQQANPHFQWSRLLDTPNVCLNADLYHPYIRDLEAVFNQAVQDQAPVRDMVERILANAMPVAPDVTDDRIREALNYIKDNLGSLQNVEQVAAHLRISPNHFNKLFRQDTGMSCWEYVKRKRMVTAREKVLENVLSVKEIAVQLGFSRTSTFTRAFTQTFGQSPTAMRKAKSSP